MATATQTETLLKSESKTEAAEVMDFLDKLSVDEKREMLIFMQGVRFAKELNRGNIQEAVQMV